MDTKSKMYNLNQCIENGTVLECPACKGLFRMIKGYKVSTFMYGEFTQMRICPECYQKYFCTKISVEFRGVNNDRQNKSCIQQKKMKV